MKQFAQFLVAGTMALALVACHAPADSKDNAPNMQIKLYQVPVQQSAAIERSLNAMLAGNTSGQGVKGSDNGMRVTEPFPGTVAVLAPAQMQRSIDAAVKQLAKTSVTSAESVPLRAHFWVVQAEPGAGADAPALQALAPTLKRVRASLGPSHFVLNEAVSTVITTDTRSAGSPATYMSTSKNHDFQCHATTTANGDITLSVTYRDGTGQTIPRIQTQTTIRAGEYVLLAQAPSKEAAANSSDATLMNLLIVRVDKLNPPHA